MAIEVFGPNGVCRLQSRPHRAFDAQDHHPLAELLQQDNEKDFPRTVAESVLQPLMEADVDGMIGAGQHERSDGRVICRDGYCNRALNTGLGTLNLRLPKLPLAALIRRRGLRFWRVDRRIDQTLKRLRDLRP